MKTKRLLLLIGSVCLALVLALPLVVACAGPDEGPSPQPTMEPQQWTMLTWEPAITHYSDVEIQTAFKEVKERTNGLLDLRIAGGGTLPIKPEEWVRAVSAGDLDICMALSGYHSGDFPLYKLMDVWYLWNDPAEQARVFYATLPIIERELNKINIHVIPAMRLEVGGSMFLTQSVDNILDLKKLKVRSYSPGNAAVIEAMNGTPVPIAWAEVYTSLERGVANGLVTGTDSVLHTKMHEVVPYGYNIGFPQGGMIHIFVNKEKWDSLPREVQNIVNVACIQAGTLSAHLLPGEQDSVVSELLATGLKEWHGEWPSDEFFERMREQVSTPMLTEVLEELGPLGEEWVAAAEKALGRTLR